LRQHVTGFAGHEPRHDFIWVKQGKVGKRTKTLPEGDNVTVFPAPVSNPASNN